MGTKKEKNTKGRRKVRKGRLLICLIAVLALVITVLFILLRTKLFPVKNITAQGSEIYSAQEIIAASGITAGKTPIFSIGTDNVLKRFHTKLPYIETVSVKRKLPDTVVITVSDAAECFAFSAEDGYYITGENCRVLNFNEEKPENLIVATVPDLEFKTGEIINFKNNGQKELFDLIAGYTKEKGIKLNSIDLTNSIGISISVEDRFEVLLGTNENIKEKIDHLAGMIDSIGDRKGKINLEMWSKNDAKGTFISGN